MTFAPIQVGNYVVAVRVSEYEKWRFDRNFTKRYSDCSDKL